MMLWVCEHTVHIPCILIASARLDRFCWWRSRLEVLWGEGWHEAFFDNSVDRAISFRNRDPCQWLQSYRSVSSWVRPRRVDWVYNTGAHVRGISEQQKASKMTQSSNCQARPGLTQSANSTSREYSCCWFQKCGSQVVDRSYCILRRPWTGPFSPINWLKFHVSASLAQS